jgi:fibronectin type 3 domain-containing protein
MKRYAYLLLLGCGLIFNAFASPPTEPVLIEWMPNSEPDFSHYLVYRSTQTNQRLTLADNLLSSVQIPKYCDVSARSGETYYYWVSAVDNYGNESPLSGPLQVLVKSGSNTKNGTGELTAFLIQHDDSDFISADPFIDRMLDNDSQIQYSWNPIPGTGISYKVYVIQGDNPPELKAEISQSSYQIQNAQNGQRYRLRVDVISDNQLLLAQGYSDSILCDIAQQSLLKPSAPSSTNAQ